MCLLYSFNKQRKDLGNKTNNIALVFIDFMLLAQSDFCC